MSTVSSRALIRLLAAAFLLLLGSGKHAHARIHERDGNTTRGIATAHLGAALPTTAARNDVRTVHAHPRVSAAYLYDGRVQSAPAPARLHERLASCERTTGESARPPPLQA